MDARDRVVALVGAAVACAVLGLFYGLVTSLAAARSRGRLRTRFARAAEGERRARALLERAGYVIEGAQVEVSYRLWEDGRPVEVPLRVDYLVRDGETRLVAEVKTGKVAPRLDHAPTRRQLLEYATALDARGVLLVDMEAAVIRRVEFSPPAPRAAWLPWVLLVGGVAAAIAAWFARPQ